MKIRVFNDGREVGVFYQSTAVVRDGVLYVNGATWREPSSVFNNRGGWTSYSQEADQ